MDKSVFGPGSKFFNTDLFIEMYLEALECYVTNPAL